MGNLEIRSRIWDAITANDSDTLRKIMKKYPEYLNRPISSDRKSNAVTRSAYLDRPHLLALLQSLGADLDQTGESGITGLMWASAKGSLDSIKFLISAGVDLSLKGPHSMNAADFGVLFGTYKSVFYLNEKGCIPSKSSEEFKKIREEMKTPQIDFEAFLLALERKVLPSQAPFFSSQSEKVLFSPRDPNETIGSWMVSVPDAYPREGQRNIETRVRESSQNEVLQEFDLD
jgi:hypothetical protein